MPVDEQRQIGVAIRKLDRLQRAVERSIEPALERRQALITAAVTGEFEVPGAA